MKNPTQKITAFILLTTFVLNVLGFFKAYFLISSKAENTVEVVHYKRLKNERTTVVTLDKTHPTLADFGFKRATDSEYLYQGEHYDVVRRESTPTGEKIYLKHDSLEEEILSFLHALFEKSAAASNAQNPIQKIFRKDFAKFYLCHVFEINSKKRTTDYIYFSPILIPESPFKSVHLQPPQPG